jgi:ribose transport system substrate-binding protein
VDEKTLLAGEVSRRSLLKGLGVGTAYAASGGALSAFLAACGGGDGSSGSSSAWPSGPDGITAVPTKPYDPDLPAGAKPSGLPARVGFVQPAANETQTAYLTGVEAAADEFDLELIAANADGRAVAAVNETRTMLVRGIGGLITQPLDPSQGPGKLEAIRRGVVVYDLVPPATGFYTADQYATGKTLGDAAAAYIERELGGRAEVLLINEGPIEVLEPRYQAIRDSIEAVGPGTRLVADVAAQPVTPDNGFRITSTALQAHPGINVILGVDDLVLGALAALEASKKADPRMFLGGVSGTKAALAKIQAGGPFKASVGYNYAAIGYAATKFTRDWLEGRSVAQVIKVAPILIDTPESIAVWNKDLANPSTIDPRYIELLGNISYEQRNRYLKAAS